jgi:hypothetical protein
MAADLNEQSRIKERGSIETAIAQGTYNPSTDIGFAGDL